MNSSFRRSVNAERPPEVFNPKDFTMAGASERDVLVYKEMFDLLDIDDNGMLTPMEIRNLLLHFQYNPKKQIIYQMVSDLDTDESGGLDFYEFLKMMTAKLSETDSDDDITKVYNMYDSDNKGYITAEDFKNVAKELKEEIKDEEIKEIMDKIDPKNKGKITYEAWMRFQKKKDFSSIGSLTL